MDFKDVVDSDYRGFIFGLDVCQYFSVEASDYDTTDNVTLNPAKRSYRRKFLEKVDEYIDQLNLLETVTEKCNRSITGQELERIDETISFILDSVWKHIEGMKRNVPFSATKIKLRATKQFYITMIRKRMGRRIDEQALQWKRKTAGIDLKE